MPGQRQWLYVKDQDSPSFATPSFSDSSWTAVGIPHGANYFTSFLNVQSGGGDGDLNGGNIWYRLHFTLGTQYANSKVMVEFEGAHTGAQVYINGTLLPGISAVSANASASHVIGFIPFLVDLTPYLHADGATDNVLAVRVSRNNSFFEQPTFSGDYRFGQAEAGLFRPAYMFITNKVHIPVNVYSNQKTWGTYVATVSETPAPNSTAQAASAVVEVQTNVLNETAATQQVTLTTQIVDANGNVVASAAPVTQTVPPMTPSTYPSAATPMFDQQITVDNPTLWYPNNSTYGTPYMYKVYHIVSVNGAVVDSAQSPLGIRIITWDHNFPYFNSHPMYLWGASGRYDYPALGSSVPEEQQWRDLAQLAAAGGSIWRPGHSTTSEEFVNAADAYGIMIDQPSGDGEDAFSTPPADDVTLKEELHRDMIVRDRSHPSILDWESNNGTMDETIGAALLAIDQAWDPINTRVAADRTPDPANGYMLGCTLQGCEVGVKDQFPNNPAWGAEYWGNGTARGLAYDYELAFAAPFLDNWRQGRQANAFGMAQWYFADSPGENGLYAEYQQYLNTAQQATYQASVRALGASMVDMNRFPKLLYYIYEAAWTPFSIKPVVHLAHHWNRAYQASAPIQVNAFSNCPAVRLLINGVQQGAIQTPNSWDSNSSANLTQSTTIMPFQTSWAVNWQAGTVEADCLDQYGDVLATDTKTTAGAESKIVLSVVPELVKPDETSFAVTANGSDVAFVTAQVQDANGVVVPTAADTLTFSVSGPATYLGGTEQYVANGSDAYSTAAGNSAFNYHAPGDPELQVEGGMTKIAVMSQFTAGTVTVTATGPGLISGSATYTIQPVPSFLPPPAAPAIVLPPVNTAVTAGQPATFTVTATGTAPLTFQWYKNGSAITGATGASYTTLPTASSDNNSAFTMTVSNGLGSATSTAATLTVDLPAAVAITTQPASQTVYVGQTAQLSVAATGSPVLTYQWYRNGTSIGGATASTYATPELAAGNNGDSYVVTITNPVNSVTSTAAVLTVAAAVAPGITQQPVSLSVLANDPATFTVGVSGSAPFTYQWQLNGVNLLGANAASYSIFQVQQTNAGNYTVVVTNAAGNVTSNVTTLTIAPPGVNLALNQPATASSSQNGGLTPNYINDGNLTTRWGSAIGVDPSWVEIDLGSVQPFDNVILYWENAYATQYQIQYSTDNTNWNFAYSNSDGAGGVENLTFPTVHGRYVRMYGQQRATQYGYSLYEMQVYNVPQCGGATERYTILSSSTVRDNVSGLTWQRAENTYTGANSQGAQYTQPIAQAYCSSQSMRLPTQAEALGISGTNSASCAFPQPWSTWTSTPDPADSNNAAFVTYAGQSSWQVANNFPGGVVCDTGASIMPPTIATQPAPQTVAAGQTASFTVAANGPGTLTYQWYRNGTAITGATASSYTTPATAATDNGAQFSVGVTNAGGSVLSNSVLLTVTTATCAAAPSVPGSLSATATSFSQIALAWGASTAGTPCSVSYSVFRGTTAGFVPAASNQVVSGQTTATYSDSGLTAATTYYYVVEAVDSSGASAPSAQASATTQSAATGSSTDVLDIHAGGGAVGSYAADEYYNGGSTSNTTSTISTAGVTNPAPQAVYQSQRFGNFTYTIPGFTAGGSYTVRLHFAEYYWTQVGQRVFNVTINGTQVLSNFDIIQAAGGPDKAVVEQFPVTANASGQIAIQFATVKDNAEINGIEIEQGGGQSVVPPAAPTGLTAAAGSPSQINLSWTASATSGAGYLVFRSTTSGFTPSSTNQITSTNTTTYADTGLTASTTYYYVVEASDSAGASAPSAQASATTPSASTGTSRDVLDIHAGGGTVGSYVADEYYNGGSTSANTATISTAGVTNPAPEAVYQTQRFGNFSYTIPGFTAGGSYTVRLHFDEYYWTQVGQRVFNVTINSTQVLTNFDIIQAAGKPEQAVVEQFPVTANSSGQIVIQFATVKDNAEINGIEIEQASSQSTPPPAAPAGLTATPASTSQINLSWTASATSGAGYLVFRSTTSGFTPASTNQIASTNGTNYADTGLTAATTYYYVVEASSSAGASTPSAQASATTQSAATGTSTDVIAIHAGGGAVGNFVADEYFTGGSTSNNTATISTAGVTNPAPEAVYQTQRFGNFTYTIPGFTAGVSYTVRLHFSEYYWTQVGQRVFNVTINGTQVLTNFDIIQAAGGPDKAVVEQFAVTANASGQIVIALATVKDNAEIAGIEVQSLSTTPPPPPVAAAPSFTPPAGTYTSAQSVALSDTTTGATIYYTTNGSTPTTSSAVYSSAIAVSSNETIQAIAVAPGYTNSAVASAAYTINTGGTGGPVAAPTSLTAVASTSSQTYLNWAASPTAGVNYLVFRSTTPNFTPGTSNLVCTASQSSNLTAASSPYQVCTTWSMTYFADNGGAAPLEASTTYYYLVEAINASGVTSTPAGPVGVTTLGVSTAGTPAELTGLTATAASANEIDLSWNASTATSSGTAVVTYRVYRATTPGFAPASSNQIGTTKANMFQDVLANASTTYYYVVEASNSSGTSLASPIVSAATAPLGSNPPFWDSSNVPPAQNVMMFKFLNRTNGVYADGQVFWSVNLNGTTTTNSIAAQPTFDMPANSAGRMYFYLGSVGQGSTNYYDFIEYTIGPTSINFDTTRVDALGIKLAARLTCGDGTDVAVGENAETFAESRATTFARYLNQVPADFQAEAQPPYAPYRIVEPGTGGFNAGGPYANYYNAYISQVWSTNGLTIPEAGANGSGLGSYPDLSAAIYRHAAGPGTFNPNGTLVSQGIWGNPAYFFQTEPYDHYAQFISSIAINGQQYAFPYNDAGGYSSDVSCQNPETLLVAIGW
jgi:hypothetical protein